MGTQPTTITPTPGPPQYLPAEIQEKWTATYKKALAQAKIDLPSNERAQRAAAMKAANALQTVTPPTSAAEIDALPSWQVLKREDRTVKGVVVRVAITIDGKKYTFPVNPPAAE